MIVLTRPAPEILEAATDDELTHYYHCDDAVARCGHVLRCIEWLPMTDEPEPEDCPTCVVDYQLSPDECRGCAS